MKRKIREMIWACVYVAAVGLGVLVTGLVLPMMAKAMESDITVDLSDPGYNSNNQIHLTLTDGGTEIEIEDSAGKHSYASLGTIKLVQSNPEISSSLFIENTSGSVRNLDLELDNIHFSHGRMEQGFIQCSKDGYIIDLNIYCIGTNTVDISNRSSYGIFNPIGGLFIQNYDDGTEGSLEINVANTSYRDSRFWYTPGDEKRESGHVLAALNAKKVFIYEGAKVKVNCSDQIDKGSIGIAANDFSVINGEPNKGDGLVCINKSEIVVNACNTAIYGGDIQIYGSNIIATTDMEGCTIGTTENIENHITISSGSSIHAIHSGGSGSTIGGDKSACSHITINNGSKVFAARIAPEQMMDGLQLKSDFEGTVQSLEDAIRQMAQISDSSTYTGSAIGYNGDSSKTGSVIIEGCNDDKMVGAISTGTGSAIGAENNPVAVTIKGQVIAMSSDVYAAAIGGKGTCDVTINGVQGDQIYALSLGQSAPAIGRGSGGGSNKECVINITGGKITAITDPIKGANSWPQPAIGVGSFTSSYVTQLSISGGTIYAQAPAQGEIGVIEYGGRHDDSFLKFSGGTIAKGTLYSGVDSWYWRNDKNERVYPVIVDCKNVDVEYGTKSLSGISRNDNSVSYSFNDIRVNDQDECCFYLPETYSWGSYRLELDGKVYIFPVQSSGGPVHVSNLNLKQGMKVSDRILPEYVTWNDTPENLNTVIEMEKEHFGPFAARYDDGEKSYDILYTISAKEKHSYEIAGNESQDVCKYCGTSKATPDCQAPTGLTAIYGQKLSEISLEGVNPSNNTAGIWTWEIPAATPDMTVGGAGSNTFYATFTPEEVTSYKIVKHVPVTILVHKYDKYVKNDKDTHKLVCSDCGVTLTGHASKAHVWNQGKVTVEPTTLKEGTKVYTCTLCGGTKEETLDKIIPTPTPTPTDDPSDNDPTPSDKPGDSDPTPSDKPNESEPSLDPNDSISDIKAKAPKAEEVENTDYTGLANNKDGNVTYYDNGQQVINAERQDKTTGGWYYFDDKGNMATGITEVPGKNGESKKMYYDETTGQRVTGVVTIDNSIYYFDDNTGVALDKTWAESDGIDYWYEDGERQGCKLDKSGNPDLSYRGKEVYDPASDGWYWLDNETKGGVAKGKDVYQESAAGDFGDVVNADGTTSGKWVRYDKNGKMVKGWSQGHGEDATVIGSIDEARPEEATYYFDPIYGTMAKGFVTIGDTEYFFNKTTGILEYEVAKVEEEFFGWKEIDGNSYWYESGKRQGTAVPESYRGKEIFDPETNAWYWLDNVDNGKKAISKDVFQESSAGIWAENKVYNVDGKIDVNASTGKWVRYDAAGHMIKGWSQGYAENAMQIDGPGNASGDAPIYYFDPIYGTMAKGTVIIDDVEYYFDETTGVMGSRLP